MRTEREKLELAAKAGGIEGAYKERWNAIAVPYFPGATVCDPWDPRRHTTQAVDLMIAIKGFGLCGDTVQEWRERVFEAAVYQGSLMHE